MDIIKELNHLTKEELIKFIDRYDTYVMEFCEDNVGYKLGEDVIPENIAEFYERECL